MNKKAVLKSINAKCNGTFDTIIEHPDWRGYKLVSCWDSALNSKDADVGSPVYFVIKGSDVELANITNIINNIINRTYKWK